MLNNRDGQCIQKYDIQWGLIGVGGLNVILVTIISDASLADL